MQPFPHFYEVSASGESAGPIQVESANLPVLMTATPPEFDGPGDLWSPETLFVGAVADCYLLTFRSIAQAARFAWNRMVCRVEGVLDRVERVTRFTKIVLKVRLQMPATGDAQRAQQLLEKAKQACLITNSLNAEVILQTEID
jgi:organic hydroperoxide reductase OsmC/OhrA